MEASFYDKVLRQALESEYGLRVPSTDPHSFRQKLYASARNLQLTHLVLITISPNDPNELWIIRRSELNHGKVKEPSR